MRGKFFHLWNAQWLLCKLANRAQTASLSMSPAAEQPAGFALSNRCEVASISRFLSTKQCVVLIDMIMSSAQFFGDTGYLLHSNWPQEVEVSLFPWEWKSPRFCCCPPALTPAPQIHSAPTSAFRRLGGCSKDLLLGFIFSYPSLLLIYCTKPWVRALMSILLPWDFNIIEMIFLFVCFF